MVREAHAIWKDGPYAGEGTLSTPSGVLNNSKYTFGSLTGLVATSTSPCEMLAAAISSSMSRMVAVEMTKVGIRPVEVETNTALTLDFVGESLRIVGAHLKIVARTRDFEHGQFAEAVESARRDCPVSSVLNVNIQCEAKLVSGAVQACA
ncbi:MAG: OsmC family peroxiredoxin [Candidatus Sulfotelmatobacter sp.]|jgi:osmotically inducible protein OsmC